MEEGPLGITFGVMSVSEDMVIQEIDNESPAAKCRRLRVGLVLQHINGVDVGEMADVQEVIRELQARPLALGFADMTERAPAAPAPALTSAPASALAPELEFEPGPELEPRCRWACVTCTAHGIGPSPRVQEARVGTPTSNRKRAKTEGLLRTERSVTFACPEPEPEPEPVSSDSDDGDFQAPESGVEPKWTDSDTARPWDSDSDDGEMAEQRQQ